NWEIYEWVLQKTVKFTKNPDVWFDFGLAVNVSYSVFFYEILNAHAAGGTHLMFISMLSRGCKSSSGEIEFVAEIEMSTVREQSLLPEEVIQMYSTSRDFAYANLITNLDTTLPFLWIMTASMYISRPPLFECYYSSVFYRRHRCPAFGIFLCDTITGHRQASYLRLLLLVCGDIESNPGPTPPVGRSQPLSGSSSSASMLAGARRSGSTSAEKITCTACKGKIQPFDPAIHCTGCSKSAHFTCLPKPCAPSYDQVKRFMDKNVFLQYYCDQCRKKLTRNPMTQSPSPSSSSQAGSLDEQAPQGRHETVSQACQTSEFWKSVWEEQPSLATTSTTINTTECDAQSPDLPSLLASVTVIKGHENPLSNFFPCHIWYKGVLHKSAEHLFHMIRADWQGRFDLFQRMRKAPTALAVKRLAMYLTSRNLTADIDIMRLVLRLKWDQCQIFRDKLLSTGSTFLCHSTYPKDKTLASGLLFSDALAHGDLMGRTLEMPGKNIFGLLLMNLRDEKLLEKCKSASKQSNRFPKKTQEH
ncbi:MAG: NADAR domain-containing protein, partial [Bacteroidota bacterium]